MNSTEIDKTKVFLVNENEYKPIEELVFEEPCLREIKLLLKQAGYRTESSAEIKYSFLKGKIYPSRIDIVIWPDKVFKATFPELDYTTSEEKLDH